MKDKKFLEKLRALLQKNNQQASDIEMTSGNYDNEGKLIADEIPTITTDFCEIGAYYNKICYFTIILYSDSFSKEIFELIKDMDGARIYGFRNFFEDYYPSNNSSFEIVGQKIIKEKYFQIQFDFDIQGHSPEDICKRHFELKTLFGKTSARIVNQMTQELKGDE